MIRKANLFAMASAASALAAAAYEFEHRRISLALIPDEQVRIQRLTDLRSDSERLSSIGEALLAEWGSTAFVGFADVGEMASKAGSNIFVAQRTGEPRGGQTAILQTIRLPLHGDPQKLFQLAPTFADLTNPASWSHAARMGGDTIVLLQITTLRRHERGAGLGSILRNASLFLQPAEVGFALTTTPVDTQPDGDLDLKNPATYTAAMRFHLRGGAVPVLTLPGYKAARDHSEHGGDVVVMRYTRNEAGTWLASRPDMRLRRTGPLQRSMARGWHRLTRIRRPTGQVGKSYKENPTNRLVDAVTESVPKNRLG